MENRLTIRDKIKVTRLAVGVSSLVVSYICLLLLPITKIAAIGTANGDAMSAGTSTGKSTDGVLLMLPLLIGLIAWLISLIGGPGILIRLLSIPSTVGYVAAVLFLVKVAK